MNAQKFSEAMSQVSGKYVEEAIYYRRKRKIPKRSWASWGIAAASVCLLVLAGVWGLDLLSGSSWESSLTAQEESSPSLPEESSPFIPEEGSSSSAQESPPFVTEEVLPVEEPFVAIASLLTQQGGIVMESALQISLVPVETYVGVYEKVAGTDENVLAQSIGTAVEQTEGWYRVSGHTDTQYLIQAEQEGYSLWKFQCFDSDEYPYRDVLELVYQIDSGDCISEIIVSPPTMDMTDAGKAIQEEIGTYAVADRDQIEALYQILTSMTCYGADHWDLIDYGSVEASVDGKNTSGDAVRLGRYLNIVTDWGNEVDGLKYTGISDMFYEFSGIAYSGLTEEQAAAVWTILQIEAK